MIKMKVDWKRQVDEYIEHSIKLPKVKDEEKGIVVPKWIHFGGGNLYRAMHAAIAQDLIDVGELDTGIVVIETFDEETIQKVYKPYNNQILQVVTLENGKSNRRLLDSTADALYGSPDHTSDWQRLNEYFENPILQFATFTITEKGYNLTTSDGEFLPVIQQDMENGPDYPKHTMSIVASALYTRFKAGELPIAMVTTDNFSRNGEKFQNSVFSVAKAWLENGLVPEEFLSYLMNTEKVTFPWTMIDRITPNPSKGILEMLKEEGFEDIEIIHTSKGTNIAPFVNTEEIHYLVMEDSFPNRRPDLSKGNILLTNRETVDKADVMKVTTCLNPLHTSLAIFGSILRFNSIAEEVRDPELKKLIEIVGYEEGLPVVVDPEVINPKEFIDEVVTKRFPNPAIPDTPQRIATDTSQKLAIRFGETIKKYVRSSEKSVQELTCIPLVLAGWLRYVLAVDDEGRPFTPSPDPLLEETQEKLSSITLGCVPENFEEILAPILSNERIFGIDLYEAGLAERVLNYFKELTSGKGAVRATLKKYVK